MSDAGVIACAKHFPGHGDTTVDFHTSLPIITKDREKLEELGLIPFKHHIAHAVPAIMTVHLALPALTGDNKPATLSHTIISHTIITDLLRNELGFTGIIITDALGMKALTDHYASGALELAALQAGNDILLCPVDVPCAIHAIKKAILNKEFSEEELNARVLKILHVKQKMLSLYPESFDPYYDDACLNSPEAYTLKNILEHELNG